MAKKKIEKPEHTAINPVIDIAALQKKKPEDLTSKEKGEIMIHWAENVKCPKEVRLNEWTLITDTKVYLSTQVGTMKAHKPVDKVWILAYMRIYDLKIFLTNKKKQQNEK